MGFVPHNKKPIPQNGEQGKNHSLSHGVYLLFVLVTYPPGTFSLLVKLLGHLMSVLPAFVGAVRSPGGLVLLTMISIYYSREYVY